MCCLSNVRSLFRTWPIRFAVVVLSACISPAQIVTFQEFDLPAHPIFGSVGDIFPSRPKAIVAGPDAALWFVNSQVGRIGRITTGGALTEYYVGGSPTQNSVWPDDVTAGLDGALWFTIHNQSACIGRISTDGNHVVYPCPQLRPYGITFGPDNALWFTSDGPVTGGGYVSAIARMSLEGQFREHLLPAKSHPGKITNGPDGALWFTMEGSIGRMTTAGLFTRFAAPDVHNDPASNVLDITAGPDGALWFTGQSSIGRMTTNGVLTHYPVAGCPRRITRGPDGALWFTDPCNDAIQRLTTAGVVTSFPLSLPGAPSMGVLAITVGPDTAFWITEWTAHKIGRAVIGSQDVVKPVSRVLDLPPDQASVVFPVRWSGTDTGSGIRDYTIYVSENGGPFVPWQTFTPGSAATFVGLPLHTYRFYSIARDISNNFEEPKMSPEAWTRTPPPPAGDLDGDGLVNCSDIQIVKRAFGTRAGQTGFDARADVNRDGVVDLRDLAFVAQKLLVWETCSGG